jgi:Ca2+:H+ antiporter
MRNSIVKFVRENPLQLLLPLSVVAVIMHVADASSTITMIMAALAMIPMASLIGDGTEALAAHSGPRLSGLLNATLGNAAELIITIVALREGLLELVKASITGSILGNILIVLGLSMVAGGLRHGILKFDRRKASGDSILLVLAVTALVIPSLFVQASNGIHDGMSIEILSLGVAGLMIIIYALGLIYGFRLTDSPLTRPSTEELVHHHGRKLWTVIAELVVATIGVVILSEIMVTHIEPAIADLGVSEFFLGVIMVPIIGNVAEHLVAVSVALKNQMSLSIEIAVGSSLQIALFVVPVLVFVSLLFGSHLTLVFNQFELIALMGGVLITAFVAMDGEANWLEGSILVALYTMLALAFFFL